DEQISEPKEPAAASFSEVWKLEGIRLNITDDDEATLAAARELIEYWQENTGLKAIRVSDGLEFDDLER
ncbi:MAG: hypothetical protein KDD43_00005, partial [Bdellovibrionales bacterium]|nr:hypothetical protein [Bdellovibrionales bacterium]